jgi:hypothetical protein
MVWLDDLRRGLRQGLGTMRQNPGFTEDRFLSHVVRRLSRPVVAAVDQSKILGVRAGSHSDHRFTGIWTVVVDGRVFARSWTLKPGGWYRTFLEDPVGAIQVGERQVRVRAVRVRAKRLLDAVERAYAEKYSTPGARKYVRGFRAARRREATIEFVPR